MSFLFQRWRAEEKVGRWGKRRAVTAQRFEGSARADVAAKHGVDGGTRALLALLCCCRRKWRSKSRDEEDRAGLETTGKGLCATRLLTATQIAQSIRTGPPTAGAVSIRLRSHAHLLTARRENQTP